MKSRLFLRTRDFFFPGVLLLILATGTLDVPAASPPNVILITIDTLRADHLQAYGYSGGRTPRISELAADGILFENVLAQAPITLPSHATILSGTYPIYHGLQDVVGRMREGVPTLALWLKSEGYQTAAFVGASVLMSQWGLDRGFDFYEDSFTTQGLAQIDFSRVERPAETVIDLTENWIQKNGSRPFFLWTHLYDPHDPYIPPEPYASEFKANPYDGEIAYVDSMLGRLFQTLKSKGLYDNSLIILTADHGESLGEHQEDFHGYYIYDASIRVPLIFKAPKDTAESRFKPGTRLPNQVRLVDVAPTVMQLLGKRVPSSVQGESLVGLMAGKRPDLNLSAYSETHYPRVHFGWSPLFSYSTPSHKFIEAPLPELYDLKADPGELHNVYKSNQALAVQMKEEMHALQRKFATSTPHEGETDLDPETLERLKSLGYIAFSSGNSASASTAFNLPDPKQKIGIYNQLNRAIVESRSNSKQSLETLKKVAVQEPEMPLVHFLLGSEYFKQGLDLKAAEEFTETIRLNPESNVARFSLARAYLQSGLSGRAEEVTRELLTSEPAHFGARHLLASILAKNRDYDSAIVEELKAIQLRPTFADAYNNLGSYYLQMGKLDLAVDSYLKTLVHAPGHLLARVNLSLAYLRQKNYDKVIEETERVVQANPGAPLAHFYMGQAFLAKGMEEQARTAFRKAKALNPKLEVPIS